jgi:hypothetical protein
VKARVIVGALLLASALPGLQNKTRPTYVGRVLFFGPADVSAAQNRLALPKGVMSVAFGTAHRYFGPGKEMCVITYPVPTAVFARGVTELSYAVELEPQTVTKASAQVIGEAPQPLRTVPCNVFTPIRGGFSQTQIGSTISRTDKAPLAPGTYKLRISVDGYSTDVTFTIK